MHCQSLFGLVSNITGNKLLYYYYLLLLIVIVNSNALPDCALKDEKGSSRIIVATRALLGLESSNRASDDITAHTLTRLILRHAGL